MSEAARQRKIQKDKPLIRHYRALTASFLSDKAHNVYNESSLKRTTELLELNPEFNAVWNERRRIFMHLENVNLELDLGLTMAQLQLFPKCYWIWNHRRWCLERINSQKVWKAELAIVSKFLELDLRNFHGWLYRRYVVSRIDEDMTQAEFDYTLAKISQNISNFSAWHNRTKLIPKLDTDKKELFYKELELVKTGMYLDSADSSVWLYMEWLLSDASFVGALSEREYCSVLEAQLATVSELNELEQQDAGCDSVWCLKAIVFILKRLSPADSGRIRQALALLQRLDPLRAGLYADELCALAAAA